MTNLVADRLRVNKLVLKVASWVASAMLRRVELWDDNLVIPPGLAARAAVFAFGDELLVLPDDEFEWRTPGGRDSAAVYLLPRAETALQRDRRRGRRGAIGGAQEQRDADDAVVSCARPALRRWPCLATSIPDPTLLAAAWHPTTLAART